MFLFFFIICFIMCCKIWWWYLYIIKWIIFLKCFLKEMFDFVKIKSKKWWLIFFFNFEKNIEYKWWYDFFVIMLINVWIINGCFKKLLLNIWIVFLFFMFLNKCLVSNGYLIFGNIIEKYLFILNWNILFFGNLIVVLYFFMGIFL